MAWALSTTPRSILAPVSAIKPTAVLLASANQIFQLQNGIPSSIHAQWPVYDPAVGQPANTVIAAPGLIDPNAGRPARQVQWSIGVQREINKDFVVEASYVGNRGNWWPAGGSFEFQ